MPPPDDVASGRERPPLIGLTGAIAAGKTEALAALGRLGAATLSTDAVVHDLLGDDAVRGRLVERWGPTVAADGEIDRNRVGALVFERPEELEWLESMLHPLVAERVASWVVGLPPHTSLAVVEVPLLFETGMEKGFDATISVVADDRVRAARAGARGTELVEGRASRQLPQAEKAARATFVVANDAGLDELEAELRELLPRLEGAGEPVR
jgi:dephospho-CoA kinase